MNTCSNCGETSEDQFDSCWKCGSALGTAPAHLPEATPEVPMPHPAPSPAGKEDPPPPAIELLVLAAILPWPFFLIALVFRRTPIPLTPVFWLVGLAFAVVGTVGCLLGVSKEARAESFSLQLCTWTCSSALGVALLLLAFA